MSKLMSKPDGLDENILIEYYNHILEKDYHHSNFSEEQKENYKCPRVISIENIEYGNIVVRINYKLEDNKIGIVTLFYEKIYPFMVNRDRFKKLKYILNDDN